MFQKITLSSASLDVAMNPALGIRFMPQNRDPELSRVSAKKKSAAL